MIEQMNRLACLEEFLHLHPRINDSGTFVWRKRLPYRTRVIVISLACRTRADTWNVPSMAACGQ